MVPVHTRTLGDSFIVDEQSYDAVCAFLLEIGIIESEARIPKYDSTARTVKFKISLELEQSFNTATVGAPTEAKIVKSIYSKEQEKFLDTPLKEMPGVDYRAYNNLGYAEIFTPRDIVEKYDSVIPDTRNFGQKSFEQVKHVMRVYGFIVKSQQRSWNK